jgi:UDP-N-acetyl-D-mannosaminuronic acid dehydrogenase
LPECLRGLRNVTLVDADTARQNADIVAFLVGHRQFRRMDKKLLLSKVVLDVIGLMV